VSTQPTAEGVGETVGEAKWAAVRELERRFPGLDRSLVAFQVISEGERGLMGVGREPARVIASLTGPLPTGRPGEAPTPAPARPRDRDRDRPRGGKPDRRRPRPPRRDEALGPEDDSPLAETARELVLAVCSGLGLETTVHVRSSADGVVATVLGEELGLLIGKHGHTIDAVEYLVNALVARRGEPAGHVTVDAQDYRRRREAVLHDAAERTAQTVVATGRPVTMEPMSSAERKVVHLYLREHDEVETESAGREPQRCVVVRPHGSESVSASDGDGDASASPSAAGPHEPDVPAPEPDAPARETDA
jgi:spoIIIJ-associated protein